MTLGIMQPYFFPYLGYFQLINLVDKFVIYDNIQYTKKGWINRNRFLNGNNYSYFTINIMKDSDYLNINERKISEIYKPRKILNQLETAYFRAPYFKDFYPIIKEIIEYENDNLFMYLYNSIIKICEYIGLSTEFVVASNIKIDHNLKSKYKVMEICKELGAKTYINPIGGIELYNKEEFENNHIDLKFLHMKDVIYKQYDNEFVSSLSIIDILMFNSMEEVKSLLKEYTIY